MTRCAIRYQSDLSEFQRLRSQLNRYSGSEGKKKEKHVRRKSERTYPTESNPLPLSVAPMSSCLAQGQADVCRPQSRITSAEHVMKFRNHVTAMSRRAAINQTKGRKGRGRGTGREREEEGEGCTGNARQRRRQSFIFM